MKAEFEENLDLGCIHTVGSVSSPVMIYVQKKVHKFTATRYVMCQKFCTWHVIALYTF